MTDAPKRIWIDREPYEWNWHEGPPNPSAPHYFGEYIRADIARAVKPLVWRNSYGVMRAETPFGDYIVTGKILRVAAVSMAFERPCDDPQAAAQADYESRILSALVPIEGGEG